MKKKIHCSVMKLMFLFFVVLSVSMVFCLTYMQQQKKEMLIDLSVGNSKETLNRYLLEFDSRLAELETYLYSFLYSTDALPAMETSQDEIALYYAKKQLSETLHEIVLLNSTVDGVWIYHPESQVFLLRNSYTGVTNQELTAVRDYVMNQLPFEEAKSFAKEGRWFLAQTGEEVSLLWVMPVKNSYCGGWISIPRLYQEFLDAGLFETDEKLSICSLENDLLAGTDTAAKQAISINAASQRADICFQASLNMGSLLAGVSLSFDYTLFTGVLLALVLISFLTYTLLVYRPFQRLLRELSHIGKTGDSSLRVTENSQLKEVRHLTSSINSFLEESQRLRIQTYEARLNEKNVNCQYLQIRLKTHFVLNCLSIIYTLGRAKKYDLVQELVLCLTRYFQFTEFDTRKFVPLQTELEHIQSYAHIQELRFPNVFTYQEDIPESLFQASVPPLILQTFIENSVSHGMSRDRQNYVRLSAALLQEQEQEWISFEIKDNGRGFCKDSLQMLSKETLDSDYSQQHGIGIKNVVNRLKLLYGNQATIRFFNNEAGGASVSIKIPYEKFVQEEEFHV